MAETDAFKKRLNALNPAQKEAVNTIEGPVMVIAGPGTGKTELLTLRIANILDKTDTPPSGILALTFTDSGARAMRERLKSLIGSRAFEVPIHTFHGLASSLVARYPDRYPAIIGSALSGDVEKIEVITEVLEAEHWEHLTPSGDPLYYVGPLKSTIAELKRENQTPESLAKWAHREKEAVMAADDLYHQKGKYVGKMKGAYESRLRALEKTIELSRAYESYQALMRAKKLYDFDDLITETIRALSGDEAFLREVQEQYLYILADEHQDANASQNAFLELLASFHENPNLFVVGDDKQAIFRFQGASLANFLYFKRRFPSASVIVLSDNYRSTQNVLDAAHHLATQSESPEDLPRVPLLAKAGSGSVITVRAFSSAEDELSWLSQAVAEAITKGTSPSEIAVLYRANNDAGAISESLTRAGVAHAIESDFDALSDPHIMQFVALLKAACEVGNDALLAPVLYFGFTGIAPIAAYQAIEGARRTRRALIESIADPVALGISEENAAPLIALATILNSLSPLCREMALPSFLEHTARAGGLLAHLISHPQALEKLAKLRSLYHVAEALVATNHMAGLSEFIAHLSIMSEHRVRVSARSNVASHHHVRLMTAHKSKGLEFSRVFIVGVTDSAWGGGRHATLFQIPYGVLGKSDGASADDDRRLLYVGMTRAKHELSISYAAARLDGKAAEPSRFLDEIDPALFEAIDMHSFTAPALPSLSRPKSPIADFDYLRALFMERGLTVTALNNYHSCPWHYFFVNLIRVPSPKTESAYFGSAVHAGLAAGIKHPEIAQESALIAFNRILEREPLRKPSLERLSRRGEKAINGFIRRNPERFAPGITSEMRVSVEVYIEGLPAPLPLKGDIDCLDARDTSAIAVIDFKTGKVKSKGDIEGSTKRPRSGDYLRQLSFYRYLLETAGKDIPTIGIIDFVEPTPKGEFVSQSLPLSKTEVESITNYTHETARSIYALSFWEIESCGTADCEFCHLRRALIENRRLM